ncbi:helix-turn-helix transcriptional regulator [Corallococcus sp. AB011P]|uniref:helix-turn-helix transcriptional regulator n=1 Tax=Corallococcus sp. AB011P TaxID=2316735 RepID=UPI0013151D69|nr:helix-turn-helix transcriptional regulator [Corallococcus sp. AB011P]
MGRALRFTSREESIRTELLTDLIDVGSYKDIHDVLEARVLQLCQADHFALGCANLDGSVGLQWTSRTTMPLLKHYSDWVTNDFVFQATIAQPNRVLSTAEMLRGQKLDAMETRQRSVEAGLDLRHVMATLLIEEQQGLKGGLAVYSEASRPFPARSQQLLQQLVPAIHRAVSRVQKLHAQGLELDLLKAGAVEPGALLVLTPWGREMVRTNAATRLLEKWFSRSELTPQGIPQAWVKRVEALSRVKGMFPPDLLRDARDADGEQLQVTFSLSTIPWAGNPLWQVRIVERPHWLREDWLRLLSPAERVVADGLYQGLSNQDMARQMKKSVQTVKDQVKAIYRKTGTQSRGRDRARMKFLTEGRRA